MLISDELNHASIIDGIRLCKAKRGIYAHMDMDSLREALLAARDARHRLVVTDGVFSMEGEIAPLPEMRELCDEHDAIIAVDDSHATGVLGETGHGTPEHYGMHGEVDIITSTLGKALGGMAGGFTASSETVVEYLTQRSRTQLFTNAIPPHSAAGALAALRPWRPIRSWSRSSGRTRPTFGRGSSSWATGPSRGTRPSCRSSSAIRPTRSH